MVSIIKNIFLKPFSRDKSSLEDKVQFYLLQTSQETNEQHLLGESLANSIFESFYLPFKRYFEYSTKNHAIAEELTQDTLLKIYRSLESFNPELAQFKTWAWTIAKNHFKDYLKSTAKKEDGALYLEVTATDKDLEQWDEHSTKDFMTMMLQDDELDRLIRQENHQMVSKAISLLSEKNREILLTWLESDLSMEELAKVHHMNVQQIKNHLFQSKKKLKEILKESKHENS